METKTAVATTANAHIVFKHKPEEFEYVKTTTAKTAKEAMLEFSWLSGRSYSWDFHTYGWKEDRVRKGEFKICTVGGIIGTIVPIKVNGRITSYTVVVGQVTEAMKKNEYHIECHNRLVYGFKGMALNI